MTTQPKPDEELGKEATLWEEGKLDPKDWEDAPEATPRAKETEAISIRIPKVLLKILKEFARREGIGYQVLIKRWLDDRVREERDRRRKSCPVPPVPVPLVAPAIFTCAASFLPSQVLP